MTITPPSLRREDEPGSTTSGSKIAAGLPSFDSIVPAYDSDRRVQQSAEHNLKVWRWIHGSLELTRTYRLEFDPIREYWSKAERRVLATYFAKRFEFCYRPAPAMRALAFKVFEHFEQARRQGRFGEPALPAKHPLGWRGLLDLVEATAREVPSFEEYRDLQREWRRLRSESVTADLLTFLESVHGSDSPNDFEPPFFKRMRWFPYLGLASPQDLPRRQLFFCAFYGLFATTNSYSVGGGLAFAPILQNNESTTLLSYAERWAAGESPAQTGFEVEGKHDRKDRSHYAPAVELYGFLNLQKQPFYNGAATVYDKFLLPEDRSVVERVQRIGELTRAFLATNPVLVEDLSKRFITMASAGQLPTPIHMEGEYDIEEPQSAAVSSDDIGRRVSREMGDAALGRAQRLTPSERAATLFHVMLDAVVYGKQQSTPVVPVPESRVAVVRDAPVPDAPGGRVIAMPPSLASLGNDALAYLRAGLHVLFAGAPGTGKTTLAQLVGHAWNRELTHVPQQIALSETPVTTVASSAWAPFHTIGGILPDKDGRFRVQKGIFIDPADRAEGEWQLRPECVVLDEMNRADLDRCVGELYPLLTHSVPAVEPAGIAGVRRLHDHPRFRLIATVNDATMDDIVFPISEGLARRFVRLELRGATEAEVKQYLLLRLPENDGERYATASALISEFFKACREEGKLQETELGEHLGFGVGYFGLLGDWVAGLLTMSSQFMESELREQALDILRTSLRSATRDRGYERIFQALLSPVV